MSAEKERCILEGKLNQNAEFRPFKKDDGDDEYAAYKKYLAS